MNPGKKTRRKRALSAPVAAELRRVIVLNKGRGGMMHRMNFLQGGWDAAELRGMDPKGIKPKSDAPYERWAEFIVEHLRTVTHLDLNPKTGVCETTVTFEFIDSVEDVLSRIRCREVDILLFISDGMRRRASVIAREHSWLRVVVLTAQSKIREQGGVHVVSKLLGPSEMITAILG